MVDQRAMMEQQIIIEHQAEIKKAPE